MASYSTSLRLVLPTTGEYPGTWGTQVNTGLTNLVDTAIAGTATITMIAADYTLSTANGAADEARSMTLNLTGTPGAARNVICPAVSKLYIVYNNTTGGFAQTVKTAAGSGISVPNGATAFLRCDGTNVVDAINYFGSLTLGTVTGGTFVSPALTGTPTAPTATAGTNTTQIATTAYVATNFAGLNSPAFTGTPTAPTATAGTSTTQLATTAFVTATAFSAILPGQAGNAGNYLTTDGTNASWSAVYPSQTGNSGKFLSTNGTTTSWADTNPSQTGNGGRFLSTNGTVTSWSDVLPSQTSNSGKFLTTNGTAASWAFAGIANVTTATTATTLTSTPTLLQITPASYGVTVTLPDATTCSVGGPLHCIDNRGGFPVRVVNTSGTLLGFVYAGVVSYISLDDKTTADGVWAIGNNESLGLSAVLQTTNMNSIAACVDLGSNQEFLLSNGPSNANLYGVVYNRSTNTFGSVTLIRTATIGSGRYTAVLSAANQVLVVSCPTGAATFEAVTLSISGTTITVNTAATATLSANISAFANGCGLIAVGSSFVTSYTVATPAAEIRALSVSGTTVTIGSASVLDGESVPLQIAVSASVVLCTSCNASNFYTKPYTVSGSTLSAGTGTTTTATNAASYPVKLAALGTRFYAGFKNGSSPLLGGVVTVSGTTSTISVVTVLASANTFSDAIIIGSNKVLILGGDATNNANILTDTAGTASAGTTITLSANTYRVCAYASGTDVYVFDGTASGIPYAVLTVSCSGASPVVSNSQTITRTSTVVATRPTASNSVLVLDPNSSRGSNFYTMGLTSLSNSTLLFPQLRANQLSIQTTPLPTMGSGNIVNYLGRSNSERWATDGASVLIKTECVA